MNETEPRALRWVGSSYKDLKAMPGPVQDDVGYALWLAQIGRKYHNAKPLKGYSGVFEIISDHQTDTYRAVYVVKLGAYIYVLHAFQKKSRRGRATPKQALEIINTRLKQARQLAKENRS